MPDWRGVRRFGGVDIGVRFARGGRRADTYSVLKRRGHHAPALPVGSATLLALMLLCAVSAVGSSASARMTAIRVVTPDIAGLQAMHRSGSIAQDIAPGCSVARASDTRAVRPGRSIGATGARPQRLGTSHDPSPPTA